MKVRSARAEPFRGGFIHSEAVCLNLWAETLTSLKQDFTRLKQDFNPPFLMINPRTKRSPRFLGRQKAPPLNSMLCTLLSLQALEVMQGFGGLGYLYGSQPAWMV